MLIHLTVSCLFFGSNYCLTQYFCHGLYSSLPPCHTNCRSTVRSDWQSTINQNCPKPAPVTWGLIYKRFVGTKEAVCHFLSKLRFIQNKRESVQCSVNTLTQASAQKLAK